MIGMSPTYHTGRATILRGDAGALPLPDSSVDLIVSSPPYWSLRAYTDGGEAYAGQIGAEPTWQEYIDNLIRCTREWVRVLKPTGSLFVNLGDKYNSAASGMNLRDAAGKDGRGPKRYDGARGERARGIPEKSLMDLPWRYGIRCVDELGLIKRAEIIWGKVNGLPESVADRVRRSHEVFLHLTKQPRYFSAVDEIREQHLFPKAIEYNLRNGGPTTGSKYNSDRGDKGVSNLGGNPLGKLPGSVWEIATEPLKVPDHLGVDHFAAFPTEWPRRLVQGWSPSGICTACGEGRRPVVDRKPMPAALKAMPHRSAAMLDESRGDAGRTNSGQEFNRWRAANPESITGEACACPDTTAPTRPSVVLDPFGGTGTTALVASVLGRHGISVDMSADYCRLARWRTTDPGQRAKAARVEKPPKQLEGQGDLFGEWVS